MKIEFDQPKMTFEMLEEGDVFYGEETLLIKITPIQYTCFGTNCMATAIDLNTGHPFHIEQHTLVTPKPNAKIIVEG